MTRLITALVCMSLSAAAFAASGKEPAPPGSFKGAPAQYTHFTTAELIRGFLALSFGSDLRIGTPPRGIRRFDHPIRVAIVNGGSVDRAAAMRRILEEYGEKVPNLHLSVAGSAADADIEVHLIDERSFRAALRTTFGPQVTRDFIARTDPQCMTSVKSQPGGAILHSVSFIIVDKGDAVFLDCAYHELLHALGLSNHDQSNPWTTLNQRRLVGYLSVYDRALLTLLYDPRILPGMTRAEVQVALPMIMRDLGLDNGK